jgi:hypothetical protein
MPKILIAAFGKESLTYVRRCRLLGLSVRILDCVDVYHKQLLRWFGDDLLHVNGRRSDVRKVVSEEAFDAAIVQEDANFVKSALIVQSLREAGVRTIIVVTQDPEKKMLYRRCGAHRVIEANDVEQAWLKLSPMLPSFATA